MPEEGDVVKQLEDVARTAVKDAFGLLKKPVDMTSKSMAAVVGGIANLVPGSQAKDLVDDDDVEQLAASMPLEGEDSHHLVGSLFDLLSAMGGAAKDVTKVLLEREKQAAAAGKDVVSAIMQKAHLAQLLSAVGEHTHADRLVGSTIGLAQNVAGTARDKLQHLLASLLAAAIKVAAKGQIGTATTLLRTAAKVAENIGVEASKQVLSAHLKIARIGGKKVLDETGAAFDRFKQLFPKEITDNSVTDFVGSTAGSLTKAVGSTVSGVTGLLSGVLGSAKEQALSPDAALKELRARLLKVPDLSSVTAQVENLVKIATSAIKAAGGDVQEP